MLGGVRWRSGRLGAPTSVWRLAMADVAVFGTAVADVVLRVAALPRPGDQIRAEPLGWRLGGGSANIACGLAAAGHEVELIGPSARTRWPTSCWPSSSDVAFTHAAASA
jgi:hypothetical protein